MQPEGKLVVAGDGFVGWHALNDTIMGAEQRQLQREPGRSALLGELIEQGGGFVSVRSPCFRHRLISLVSLRFALIWPAMAAATSWRWPVPMGWRVSPS